MITAALRSERPAIAARFDFKLLHSRKNPARESANNDWRLLFKCNNTLDATVKPTAQNHLQNVEAIVLLYPDQCVIAHCIIRNGFLRFDLTFRNHRVFLLAVRFLTVSLTVLVVTRN